MNRSSNDSIQRFVLKFRPLPPPVASADLPAGGLVVVVGDAASSSASIAAEFARRGYEVRASNWSDAPAVANPPAALVLVAPVTACPSDLPLNAWRWMQLCGEALQRRNGLLVAVVRLDRFGIGAECGGDPVAASLAGLVKTARHEWPTVTCRVVDVSPNVRSTAVVDELLAAGPVEVALGSDERLGLRLVAESLSPSDHSPALRAGELVVVSGGARGVTADAVCELASTSRPALLILGRTPVPEAEPDWLAAATDLANVRRAVLAQPERPTAPKDVERRCRAVLAGRELRSNLQRFRDAGAAVIYRAVDVTDDRAVASAVAEARAQFGPACGLVHGSGVLADRRILDQTPEQFAAVFDTKVAGLRNLLAATAGDPLRFVALFSSSTARLGRTGQCAYAAANEVLNATARQMTRPGCRAVAFNWGPWDGGMVTPELRRLFELEGVGVIPLRDGARFFVNELARTTGPADVVVLGPPPARELTLTPDHPVLRHHVIAARPVLPIALAIELLAAAARCRCPGQHVIGLDRLRVLRPIAVPPAGARIRVEAVPDPDRPGVVHAAIHLLTGGPSGPAFDCAVVLDDGFPSCDLRPVGDALDVVATADAYRNWLFHGPTLRGIESIALHGANGLTARARVAPPAADWAIDGVPVAWSADPLAVDCALQAVIVWCQARLGMPCLPTALRGYRQFRPSFGPGPVTINVDVIRQNGPVILANVNLFTAEGRAVARIEGCEMVRGESLASAFRTDSLAGAAS